MEKRSFSIGESFAFGWKKIKENLILFALSTFVLFLVVNISNLIRLFTDQAFLIAIMEVLGWILYLLVYMGMIGIFLQIHDGESAKFGDIFSYSFLFFKVLIAFIIYYFAVLVGLIFFIFPGIYLMIKLFFFEYLIIDRDCGVVESLQKSYEITKGVGLNLFLFLILSMFLNLFGLMLLGVGILITFPVFLMASIFIYRELLPEDDKGLKKGEAEK